VVINQKKKIIMNTFLHVGLVMIEILWIMLSKIMPSYLVSGINWKIRTF
jgi:hypothetical protein